MRFPFLPAPKEPADRLRADMAEPVPIEFRAASKLINPSVGTGEAIIVIPEVASVESVMPYRFGGRITGPQVMTGRMPHMHRQESTKIEEPAETLTPQQQLAMLVLRRSNLSKLVVDKLWHSTVRPTRADFDDLLPLHLARLKPDGRHELTPRGHFKANAIASRMALELNVTTQPCRPSSFSLSGPRRLFGMSDSGNA